MPSKYSCGAVPVLLAALSTPIASIAIAQPEPASVAATLSYAIPAGPLAETLSLIARQSGKTIAADPALVAGRNASAVQGDLTAEQALLQALEGSGLELVTLPGGGLSLRVAPSQETTLKAVKVQASGLGGATENSGSYTAGRVGVGAKMEQSLREIPRSISVIGREQLDDQRITTFDEALEQLPGVTFEPITNGWGAGSITVRGQTLTNIMVDGSPSRGQSDGDSSFNTGMAKYDNIQLLRGPDGLFSGNGQPSGSINLVRKRPLETPQTKIALSVGRWHNYLGEVDASLPLTESGAVRGRGVVSYNDSEKFFENAHRKSSTVYGVLEADMGDATTWHVGFSDDRRWGEGQDYAPAFPRYTNGAPLPVGRDFGHLASSFRDTDSLNYFGGVVHQLNASWTLKANLSRTESDGETVGSFYIGAADPITGTGSTIYPSALHDWESTSTAMDTNLSGNFNIADRAGKLVVGADYLRTTNDWTQTYATHTGYPVNTSIPIDWATFDPGLFRDYTLSASPFDDRNTRATQMGAYFYGSLQVYGPVTAVAGGRYARYEQIRYDDAFTGSPIFTEKNRNHDVFTPYYSVIYNFAQNWSAYLTMAESFESQSHRYTEDHRPLDPATGTSYELGIKGEHWDGKLQTNITFYRSKRQNVAVSASTDSGFGNLNPGLNCCYSDDGEYLSEGVEFDISGELLPNFQVNAGYTYDDNKTDFGASAGDRLTTNTPRHIFRAWTRYRLPQALSAVSVGMGVKAQSSYFRSGTVRTWNASTGAYDGPNQPYEFTEGGRALWNAFAEYRIDDHWTAALNINNLFDKRYFKSVNSTRQGNIYGDPRDIMLTLRGQF